MIDRDKEFFVIRSDALDAVRTRLYGYSVSLAGIVTNDCLAAGGGSSQLTPEGAWVFVERLGDTIFVRQDFVGCYGLYLFRDGDFWALSNCYNYLVDCLKSTHRLTLNRDYADHLLASGLAALACEETLVNEVICLDRAAVVTIDCATRRLSTEFVDYRESTLDLDTSEGMAELDEWFFRWTGIIRNLAARNGDIQTDLSGGFDSRLTLALFLGSGVDLGSVCQFQP